MIYNRAIWWTLCAILSIGAWANSASAVAAKLTFYLPLDGSLQPSIADGSSAGKFAGKPDQLHFTAGLHGQGWLNGELNQAIAFPAEGNISQDRWTITFWVKGLKDADWNSEQLHENAHQEFWQLLGNQGEALRFYKYNVYSRPWLLYTAPGAKGHNQHLFVPKVPEQQWHYWAVTWRKGTGACIYLDGHLVAQDASFRSANPVKQIVIGQMFGKNRQDRILDEFKIYDAALAAGEVAQHYYEEGDFATQPVLSVTPTRHKITIDGKISEEEWAGTTGFSGLIDPKTWTSESPATRGRITYDQRYLYITMHSDMPAEIKNSMQTTVLKGFLKHDATQHDGLVSADDSYYLKIVPPDGDRYLVYANGINTTYDYRLPKTGGVNLSWESDATVKSIVDEHGWSMEMAIPLKALGVKSPAGQTWHMDMGRIWKMLRQRTDQWAAGRRVDDTAPTAASGLGTVRFLDQNAPAVDLKQFTISQQGKVEADLVLSNPGSKTHTLRTTLQCNGELLQSKSVAVTSGQSAPLQLAASADKFTGQLVEVVVKDGQTLLLRQALPYIPHQIGQLAMWKYPSRGQLRIGWVLQSTSDPAALRLDAQLVDGSGTAVANKTVEHLPSARGSTLMDVKALPVGRYTLLVRILNANNVVQQQSFDYDKKPLPSWLGNTLGISQSPPPPWTDLMLSRPRDAVSIWGRTYDYDGRLLPSQIINQEKAMLAAPMSLVLKTAAGDSRSAATKAGSVNWTKATAMRADSSRVQTLGPVRFKADSYVDFDGMTWMELTVSPADKPTMIDSLAFEIPLKSTWGKLINTYDYSLRQTGTLPADGWHGSARPVWVGNGDGGIQFFQQTTANWVGSRGMSVTRDENGHVILRVNLIDQACALDKSRHFAFGWMASPVKASPRDHRDWRLQGGLTQIQRGDENHIVYLRDALPHNPGLKTFVMWWQGWWWLPPSGYKGNSDHTGTLPVPSGNARCNAVLENVYGATVLGAPYGRLSQIGTDNPWFAQFGDEWLADVNEIHRSNPHLPAAERKATVSQAARSLRDYFAWGYNQLLETDKVHALYFDVSTPVYDNNIYHGAGTIRPDAPPVAQYNILGIRKSLQRIYTILKSKHPNGRIFYHMSGQVLLPIDSFSDGMVDGENFTGMLDRKQNRGYENVLKIDQFRAEYAAQNNFGPATVFLPEFGRSGAMKSEDWKRLGYGHADYVMGLILLHDSNIWWAYIPQTVLTDVYLGLDKAGLNSSWSFVPYWNQKYVTLPGDVKASFYIAPDRSKAVAIIMNVSDRDQQLDLAFDSALLDGQSPVSAVSLYPDDPLRIGGGAIRGLTVKRNNFKAILLQR